MLITLLLAGIPAKALTFTVDGITYSTMTSSPCVSVTSADASLTSITLPSSVMWENKSYDVAEIYFDAFTNNAALTEITIPATVSSIRYRAFKGCKSLKKVVFLDGNADLYIGYCWAYSGESDNVEGQHAFYYCPLQEVYIGRNITYGCDNSMGWSPFANTPLQNVTIAEGVTTIKQYFFHDCTKLTSLNLPSTLTNIDRTNFGEDGFLTCTNLNEINVSPNNQTYSSIDGVLYDKAQKNLIMMLQRNWTSYVMPTTVETVEACACMVCRNLSSLTLSPKLKKINAGAFLYSNLNTIIYDVTNPVLIDTSLYYYNIFNSAVYQNATLYINPAGIETAKSIRPWKDFKNIQPLLPASLNLNVSNLSMIEDDVEQILATNSAGDILTSNLTWSSSNASVATVSEHGDVKAVGLGEATITCKWIAPSGIELTQTVAVEVKDYVLRIVLPNGYTELQGAARNSYKFRFGCEEGYTLHQVMLDDEDITSEVNASSNRIYEVQPARKDRVMYAIFRSDTSLGIESVDSANDSDIKLKITEGHIEVTGAKTNSEVMLYDTNGNLLKKTKIHSFDTDSRGIMILSIDSQTFKFVL